MKLNEAQKKILVENLHTQGVPKRCLVCGAKELVLSDKIFQLAEFGGMPPLTTSLQQPTVLPVVYTLCQQCGHVELFSPVKLGLFEK